MNSQHMVHPERWRETCDPFALNYNNFQLKEVLGYPHARNDVFHARGTVGGEEMNVYIKAARQNDSAIDNEVSILAQLDAPIFPKVLDHEHGSCSFSVTSELPGLRLSTIAGENKNPATLLPYMEKYGEALGRLHILNISAKPQADRKFYHRPDNEMLKRLGLRQLENFFDNKPSPGQTVFCHGDFHYANVLWNNHDISAILDFELAGYGNRDFDIAWALFLRPGQQFLKTKEELAQFMKGYRKYGECDEAAVKYYMAQCYVHFLCFCDDEADYSSYVRGWLDENCRL